jgi:hypothetical protein
MNGDAGISGKIVAAKIRRQRARIRVGRLGSYAVVGACLALVVSLAACGGSSSSSAIAAQPASAASAAPGRRTTAGSHGTYPDASAIANAASDDDNWFLPGKTLLNNRNEKGDG